MDRSAASEWWNREERLLCSCRQLAIRAIGTDGGTFSVFCRSCGATVRGGDMASVIKGWEAMNGNS